MNDLITSGSDKHKPRSFWDRPEGTTGMLAMAGLGLGGFFVAKKFLPVVLSVFDMAISMVGKAITLTALGSILFVMLYVLFNPTFQMAVSAIFKNAMRKLTGWVVEIDPIGIMRNYVDILKKKKIVMDQNVTALRSQISVMEQKIEKNTAGIDNAMRTAAEAKKQSNNVQFSLNARSAGRLEKSNMTYQQMLAKMQVLYRALKKYQDAVEVTIVDLTEEIAVKDDQRKSIIAASRAMRGAMAILMGSGPDKELFDQAMEFTVSDYGQRLGEIDDFMDTTKSILDGMDLQNGVYDAAALEKLEAWEARADSIVLGGDGKRLMLEDIQSGMANFNTAPQAVKVPTGDFDQFFQK